MCLQLIYPIVGLLSFNGVLCTELGHSIHPTANGYTPKSLPIPYPAGYQDFNVYPANVNNPPLLSNPPNWDVTEDEEVGTVVQRLSARDDENDHVTFNLEPGSYGQDGSSLFVIDDEKLKIKQSLLGKAGRYFVKIRAHDGFSSSVSDIRVTIKHKGARGRDVQRKPQRPFGLPHGGGFAPERPNISPPLLHLDPGTTWMISSHTKVGTIVDTVQASDLHGLPVTFTIEPKEFVEIDNGGVLMVKQSLEDKVGTHQLQIIASNGHASISEVVFLNVTDPTDQSASTLQIHKDSTEKTHSPTQPTLFYFPQPTSPQISNTRRPDITFINGKIKSITSTAKPVTQAPTPSTAESNEAISTTVIPIVVVLVPCLAVLAFILWRKRSVKQKAAAEAKGSTVKYSEKGEVITTNSNITSKQRSLSTLSINGIGDSLSNAFLSLWHKRAEENKYENDIEDENRKNRKRSEVSNPVADKWEVLRHHIKILGILGEGCFGQVWKAEAVDIRGNGPMLVAVKTLKERAGEIEKRDLIQELKVLKGLGRHPNVVSLLGCCTEKDPLFVILEYMIGGKLQSYLRASRTDTSYNNLHSTSSSLTPRDLTIFAHQIARGMEFLASRGIIHRDLAARNILVGEEKICKVADFGFARDVTNNHIYERKSDGRLPIRWMAPESLFDHIYTTKSDVWSFGVLLWEIVTLGSTPYPGLGASEVMKIVKEGKRLDKPEHCRREIYNIMYYCWNKDPVERPSFTDLVETLEGLLLSQVEYIQLDKFPDHNYYNFLSENTGELL